MSDDDILDSEKMRGIAEIAVSDPDRKFLLIHFDSRAPELELQLAANLPHDEGCLLLAKAILELVPKMRDKQKLAAVLALIVDTLESPELTQLCEVPDGH